MTPLFVQLILEISGCRRPRLNMPHWGAPGVQAALDYLLREEVIQKEYNQERLEDEYQLTPRGEAYLARVMSIQFPTIMRVTWSWPQEEKA